MTTLPVKRSRVTSSTMREWFSEALARYSCPPRTSRQVHIMRSLRMATFSSQRSPSGSPEGYSGRSSGKNVSRACSAGYFPHPFK